MFYCFHYFYYYYYRYYYYYIIINTGRGAIIRVLQSERLYSYYFTGTIRILYGAGGSANVLPGHVAAVDFNVRFNRERMHRIASLNVYYFNSGARFELPRTVGRKNENKIGVIKMRAYYYIYYV